MLNVASERDVELGIFLWLAVTTGARRGEVTALRWPSIDFESRLVVFCENYVVRAGQRRLKGTKTDTERVLSLDPESVQMSCTRLSSHVAAGGGYSVRTVRGRPS